MANFIVKTTEPCCDCGEVVDVYRVPLPRDGVSYNFFDGFQLLLDEEEMRTLYLALKEHMLDLVDVQPEE